jgi:hypothetical protein
LPAPRFGSLYRAFGVRAAGPTRICSKAWDEQAFSGWHEPLAEPGHDPVPLTCKSYPVCAPGREPAGYSEKLRRAQPELVFDTSQLRSDAHWIRAGELVFDAPPRELAAKYKHSRHEQALEKTVARRMKL